MADTVGVTVMFTDLVDSTGIATRLGADEAERLRLTHFTLLRAAIGDHGGVEVKNLGDGFMAAFPSSAAALDAAVAIEHAVFRHGATNPEPLAVRIGIAAGDCTVDADDYFGEPVVIAARLCARADAGEILVPDHLRHLVPRGRFAFTPIGPTDLKGIPEPVVVATLDWEPPDSTAHARVLGVLDRLAGDA